MTTVKCIHYCLVYVSYVLGTSCRVRLSSFIWFVTVKGQDLADTVGHHWHGRGISPLLPDCAVVGRLTQGIAKVVSGVEVERWSFFQDHFIAPRWEFLLICCCVHVVLVCFSPSSNSFRWKYIGNGKLGQFCVWMAVTPGVWVSWPPGRRGKHFHSAAKQTLLRRLLFSQTAICMYMLWYCYTTL